MKIDKKIIQEKQKSEQLEKDKICLEWFNNQRFLTKDDREYLVNELIDLQQQESREWAFIHRPIDENIPDWKQHRDRMYFKIDLLNLKIDKIKEVLINNKFK
jgi:hypothetical protein